MLFGSLAPTPISDRLQLLLAMFQSKAMQSLRRSYGGRRPLWENFPLHISRYLSSQISQVPVHQILLDALESSKLSLDSQTAIKTHARIITCGYETNPSILASLISTYTHCHHLNSAQQLLNHISTWPYNLESNNILIKNLMRIQESVIAEKLLHQLPVKDVVTWNTVIGGLVKNGCFEAALSIFRGMLSSNVKPDEYSFSSAIAFCARLGILDHALWVHEQITVRKIGLNPILSAALIDMYAKCGKIQKAIEIFDSVTHCESEISVWNAMINGLAIHGLASEAIVVFSKMEMEKVVPDAITFLGILNACRHSGLIKEGKKFFNLMKSKYSVLPRVEHYGAMVDLFARVGLLDDAFSMIKEMPMEPDVVIWRTLLGASRFYRKPELGEVAVANISKLSSGDLVLLSNTYCSLTKWDSAETLRDSMKKKGIKKKCGKSWIEVAGAVHHFKAGDRSHPETKALYRVLDGLIRCTKLAGFAPSLDLVLMDVSEEEREESLSFHSEKLAVAYGILKSSPGMEIVVLKNLRICCDCHSWMKLVSKLLRRVIVVRDRVRFHRFEDGLCSCGDFW